VRKVKSEYTVINVQFSVFKNIELNK